MKAVIVKDNDFQTIGFEVTQGNNRLFIWGISPQTTTFIKEVVIAEWISEIVELIKLQATIIERSHIVSEFFKISVKAFPTVKQSANFDEYEAMTAQLIRRSENIIKNII